VLRGHRWALCRLWLLEVLHRRFLQTAMAKGGPFGCRIIGTLLNAGIPFVTLLASTHWRADRRRGGGRADLFARRK
jgi:hypothetical protein